VLGGALLTPLASSETRCLTSCEHFSSEALVPPARRRSVCVLHVGIPRQSRPWHEMNQPIRRWKTALHPLFLLGLLRRTLQRKQQSMYIQNLRRQIRLAHWPAPRPVLGSLAAPQDSVGHAMSSRRIATVPAILVCYRRAECWESLCRCGDDCDE
jgi:hypothetical protein